MNGGGRHRNIAIMQPLQLLVLTLVIYIYIYIYILVNGLTFMVRILGCDWEGISK